MLKTENGVRAIDMHCHYSHGVPEMPAITKSTIPPSSSSKKRGKD